MVKSTNLPKAQLCPSGCGYKMEAATEAYGDATPSVGDISICFGCNAVHLFDEHLQLRLTTPDEALQYSLMPEVIKVQMARQAPGMPPLRQQGSQVVRQESAKLPIAGSIPAPASK